MFIQLGRYGRRRVRQRPRVGLETQHPAPWAQGIEIEGRRQSRRAGYGLGEKSG